jgi:hypothetical protein
MSSQYIRKVSLIAYGNPGASAGSGLGVPGAPATGAAAQSSPDAQPQGNQSGVELGNLRIQFQVHAMDTDCPPTAIIRVLNMSKTTAERFSKEFQSVVLQAGYENGNFGIIFQGTIIRVRKGRLKNIDSFVDIMASNLDAIYNFGVVNKTLAAGASFNDQKDAIQQSVNNSPAATGQAGALAQGLQFGSIPDSVGTGGTLPRGKVLFGLARDKLSDLANSTGSVWSIGPDGKVNFHTLTGYLPGEAVVLNAQTGMIGVPEATPQGIEVRCLLNPLIKPGTRIQLNNKDLVTTANQYQGAGFPAYGDFQFFANTSKDGVYMTIVVEHEGDNRGQEADWLTKVIALSVDSSGNSGAGQVAAYG